MTQKQLRKLARETLATILKNEKGIVNTDLMNCAIQVLHAPERKGE